MSSQSTINELTEDQSHVLPLEVFSVDATTGTTETMVDSTMNVSECSAYLSSPAEATCVAVIIGCNAPTGKSILISPSRTSSSSAPFPRSHPPSRTSSTTSTTLPTPADGVEPVTPATTRPSSFDSSNEDSVCPQGEELSPEQRLNVKFAPLPDMGPRKRRGMPLGVAARSRMVRRRKAQAGEPGAQPRVVATPMWTDEEMDVQRQRLAKAWEKEREKRDYYSELDENGEPIEDPITALGKLVKVAGKQLWNKIGGREGKNEKGKVRAREKEKDALSGEQRDSAEARCSISSSQGDCTSSPTEERTPMPDDIDNGRDGSWEEVRRKEIPRTQSDDGTIARKLSLWRRTRTASRIEGDSSSMSITKSGKNSSMHPFSGRKSDASKGDEVLPENKDGSSAGLRRSLSF